MSGVWRQARASYGTHPSQGTRFLASTCNISQSFVRYQSHENAKGLCEAARTACKAVWKLGKMLAAVLHILTQFHKEIVLGASCESFVPAVRPTAHVKPSLLQQHICCSLGMVQDKARSVSVMLCHIATNQGTDLFCNGNVELTTSAQKGGTADNSRWVPAVRGLSCGSSEHLSPLLHAPWYDSHHWLSLCRPPNRRIRLLVCHTNKVTIN